MSLEENKSIVRKIVEAENKRNLAVIDELIAPTYFIESLQLRGSEGHKQLLRVIFKAFPDWRETIQDMVAEGDKVVVSLDIETGAQTGEFSLMGVTVPPTGNKSKTKSIQIWRIVGGKVVGRESVYDWMGLYRILGLIEPTEKGKELFPEEFS